MTENVKVVKKVADQLYLNIITGELRLCGGCNTMKIILDGRRMCLRCSNKQMGKMGKKKKKVILHGVID
jgi:hypothetical protein